MILHPAVIVHGLADAKAVLAVGWPVTLLSAPGAVGFAGCLWWREMIAAAAAVPDVAAIDILDCGDASGLALGALRSGVHRLILRPEAPGWAGVAAVAKQAGGFVLSEPPAALDLAQRGAVRRLEAWLRTDGTATA